LLALDLKLFLRFHLRQAALALVWSIYIDGVYQNRSGYTLAPRR
jgi:hypothetical protein